MENMEKAVFCLVLEKQKGDYKIVDINELIKIIGIPFGYVNSDEISIDSFTKLFTENELRDVIKRSNIIPEDYLQGSLRIVSNMHHRLPVITKDKFTEYFKIRNNEENFDINLKNKILSRYHKILEMKFKDTDFINGLLERANEALKTNNKSELFRLIEMPELDYHYIRPIYITIMDDIEEHKNTTKEIERLDTIHSAEYNNILKLEKLNDVA